MLELYHNDMSTCAQKVRLTLAEKGLAWEGRHLDLRAGDQQKPEYLKLNPRGVVPTIVDNGKVVRESTVIMEYLDDEYPKPSLRPRIPMHERRCVYGPNDSTRAIMISQLPRSAWGSPFVSNISRRDRRRAMR